MGATIDERTNGFTMEAIAFGLLGRESDRSSSKWGASDAVYAVGKDRTKMFSSVAEFYQAWRAARYLDGV